MDDTERLLNALSNLPGFQWEKSREIANHLVDRGYVWQVRMGTLTPSQLIGKLKMDLFRASQEEHPKMLQLPSDITQVKEEEHHSLRQVVLSHLITLDAAKNPQVQLFRQRILRGTLLRLVDVQWWILIQALQDGQPATLWLHNIPIPREQGIDLGDQFPPPERPLTITVSPEQIAGSIGYHYLQFGLPDSPLVHEVAITSGGILEMLRNLILPLADRYVWTEAQATLFVLTGLSPLISDLTTKVRHRHEGALSRIIQEIDPAVSPGEVTNNFLQERTVFVGLRQRDMGEKNLRLALFAAMRPQEERWVDSMHTWNQVFPQWSYKRESNFGTDSILAQRRLLNPDNRRAAGLLPLKRRGLDGDNNQEETRELEDGNE